MGSWEIQHSEVQIRRKGREGEKTVESTVPGNNRLESPRETLDAEEKKDSHHSVCQVPFMIVVN